MRKFSLKKISYAIARREFQLAGRQFSAVINPSLFFILVVLIFPLALTPENHLLQQIAPGVMWTAALLANLLGMDRLFRADYEEGLLEQYMLSPYSLHFILIIKIFIHWLLTNFPLIILTPLFGVMFHIDFQSIQILMLSLLLGTPTICLIGAVALAITLRLQSNSVLLALCVLPLMIPILIFGAGSTVSISLGLAATSQLAILGAILILSATFLPGLISYALRIGVE